MRWTVAVFAAALVIFVAATAGVTDDGQAGGRLGDDERLTVTRGRRPVRAHHAA